MIYYNKVGVPRSALQFCQCQCHPTVRIPIHNSIITLSNSVLHNVCRQDRHATILSVHHLLNGTFLAIHQVMLT